MVVDFRCSNRRTSSNVWKCQIHFAVFLYFLLRNSTRKSVCFIAGRSSRTCPSQTRWGCFTKKYTRLCVPLREPLRPLRLNFKSHKVQEAFTAEDAEDFAEVPREALQPKGVSSWYLPVADATRWDALREIHLAQVIFHAKVQTKTEGARKNSNLGHYWTRIIMLGLV